MDRFSREDLQALLANGQTPCVSLLMRTTRGPGLEDKARWKSQVGKAEEFLTAWGRRPEAQALLGPAQDLLNDLPFWQSAGQGLAVFLAPGVFRAYRLPLAFDDRVVVAERFHVKPLLPLLGGEGRFYVLALDRAALRLLQATPDTVQEIDLRKAPANVAEAFAYGGEAPRREAVATVSGPGRPQPAFDTAGIAANSTRDGLLKYFHQVDRGLRELLRDEEAPLVLAGPEELMALYRQANGYRHLLGEGVECQPDQLAPEQLRDRARAVVRRQAQEARDKVLALYRQLAGTGRTTHDLEEILSAAHQGRIQYLIADRLQERWGTFDPATRKVQAHDRQETGDEDLLNFAVVHVLAHRGEAYAVEPAELPEGAPLAAIFWLPLGERSGKRVLPEVTRA
jgi:hypothetical protein